MNIVDDERGQGAAEYILLFGGVIVVAVAALIIYQSYLEDTSGLDPNEDINAIRTSVDDRQTL
ncbi:MAG TPA: class III signal peptide-containing protein [Methanobacterium sp.]|jgi:hypothetical protein|nr:class III signal peptide-containing protein [Methanobacterium sp.]